jgi:hypothetical protein
LAGRKALARNPKCGGEWRKWDPPQSLTFPPKEFTNENVIVALGFNKDPRRWELPFAINSGNFQRGFGTTRGDECLNEKGSHVLGLLEDETVL